jgi:hypothetical protein
MFPFPSASVNQQCPQCGNPIMVSDGRSTQHCQQCDWSGGSCSNHTPYVRRPLLDPRPMNLNPGDAVYAYVAEFFDPKTTRLVDGKWTDTGPTWQQLCRVYAVGKSEALAVA